MFIGREGDSGAGHGIPGKGDDTFERVIFDGIIQFEEVLLELLLGGCDFSYVGVLLLAHLSLVENFLFVLLDLPEPVDKGGLFEGLFLEAGDAFVEEEKGFAEMLIGFDLAGDGIGLLSLLDQLFGGDHCGVCIVQRFV